MKKSTCKPEQPSLVDGFGFDNGVQRRRDPLLDNAAVILYRNVAHLQLNHVQRQFVADAIECSERGLRIWEAVLIDHMAHGWNPKNIPFMLKTWQGMYYG